MGVNGYSTVKESEAADIDNKDDDNGFFDARRVVYHEFVPQGQTVNQQVYISVLRRMREALRRRRPDLGIWTVDSIARQCENTHSSKCLKISH
jgi:hypothetical protein